MVIRMRSVGVATAAATIRAWPGAQMNRRLKSSPLTDFAGLVLLNLVVVVGVGSARGGQAAYELEPINYSSARAQDAIAKVQAQLDAGKAKLNHVARHGYLTSLLQILNIPESSQTLVFSKTSLQRDQISPQTPRALYFNDDVYVGWTRGGAAIEIASTDPKIGTVFYTLDQRPTEKPRFVRQTDACIQCHGTSMTGNVPGLLIRSVHTDPTGMPVLTAGTSLITQNSPLEDRWGGWYVTGTHGDMRHQGNLTAKDRDDGSPLDVEAGANVKSLADRFDTPTPT
jgi:hypothetical protein